jgi:hypothetical protein
VSKPNYTEGQEIAFGINDGTFSEAGFLDGATVKVVTARYGKETELAPEYRDPTKAYAQRIVAKFAFSITKQDGSTKEIKPQEYSTGIAWDGEKSTATVTPDGKRLVAKKGFAGFNKVTDFYHLLETAVNAGFPEDGFKGDLSVFDGLTFQLASEANPRGRAPKDGKEPRKKPFFGLLIGSTAPVSGGNGNGKTVTPEVSVSIDPNILAAGVQALTSILSESPTNSITRRDIAGKIPSIADRNQWELNKRVGVMNALFEPAKLAAVVTAAGLKLNGETVTV